MQDLAEAVVTQLRVADRPSAYELRATGLDFCNPAYSNHNKKHCDVLKVTVPEEMGTCVIQIMYLDNHDTTYDTPRQYRNGWQTLTFDKDEWRGAAAFVDGFMQSGGRTGGIALYKKDSCAEIARWSVSHSVDGAARIEMLGGVVKSLFGR